MKKEMDEEITKELDEIYGIKQYKNEILNYVRYLKMKNEENFANFNIIIHNSSSYPLETKMKLINFLYKILKENNIIKTGYEYMSEKQLRKFEISNDRFDRDDMENFKFKNDLIIIDSDKLRYISSFRDEIIAIMEKFKDKVFILIDQGYCIGEANAMFNQYFDWYFEIDKISDEDKKDYVMKLFEKNNIKIDMDSNFIEQLIADPFYMMKTKVNNVTLKCKLNNIEVIDENIAEKYFDIIKPKEQKTSKKKPQEEKIDMNSMIGIDEIKEQIDKIVNYVKICKKRKGKMPSLHMCFTGNPGTGKTTVARILGDTFKKEKILSSGNFVEIHGRDLVGKYVGWTAQEVKKHIKSAMGGILFIDEAYSLNSNERGSFEDEAIDTLIKEMEDKRNDLCVILAGYKDEMEELIKRNPGFESRIQFYVDFPNYNEEELYEIFKNLAKKEKYKLSSNVREAFEEKARIALSNSNFSNGRFVRNLYEKVKMEQACRVASEEKADINLIKKSDIDKVDIKRKREKTNKIGF